MDDDGIKRIIELLKSIDEQLKKEREDREKEKDKQKEREKTYTGKDKGEDNTKVDRLWKWMKNHPLFSLGIGSIFGRGVEGLGGLSGAAGTAATFSFIVKYLSWYKSFIFREYKAEKQFRETLSEDLKNVGGGFKTIISFFKNFHKNFQKTFSFGKAFESGYGEFSKAETVNKKRKEYKRQKFEEEKEKYKKSGESTPLGFKLKNFKYTIFDEVKRWTTGGKKWFSKFVSKKFGNTWLGKSLKFIKSKFKMPKSLLNLTRVLKMGLFTFKSMLKLLGKLLKFGGPLIPLVVGAIMGLSAILKGLGTLIAWGVKKLVLGVYWIWKNRSKLWASVIEFRDSIFKKISNAWASVINGIKGLFEDFVDALKAFGKNVMKGIEDIYYKVLGMLPKWLGGRERPAEKKAEKENYEYEQSMKTVKAMERARRVSSISYDPHRLMSHRPQIGNTPGGTSIGKSSGPVGGSISRDIDHIFSNSLSRNLSSTNYSSINPQLEILNKTQQKSLDQQKEQFNFEKKNSDEEKKKQAKIDEALGKISSQPEKEKKEEKKEKEEIKKYTLKKAEMPTPEKKEKFYKRGTEDGGMSKFSYVKPVARKGSGGGGRSGGGSGGSKKGGWGWGGFIQMPGGRPKGTSFTDYLAGDTVEAREAKARMDKEKEKYRIKKEAELKKRATAKGFDTTQKGWKKEFYEAEYKEKQMAEQKWRAKSRGFDTTQEGWREKFGKIEQKEQQERKEKERKKLESSASYQIQKKYGGMVDRSNISGTYPWIYTTTKEKILGRYLKQRYVKKDKSSDTEFGQMIRGIERRVPIKYVKEKYRKEYANLIIDTEGTLKHIDRISTSYVSPDSLRVTKGRLLNRGADKEHNKILEDLEKQGVLHKKELGRGPHDYFGEIEKNLNPGLYGPIEDINKPAPAPTPEATPAEETKEEVSPPLAPPASEPKQVNNNNVVNQQQIVFNPPSQQGIRA